MCERSEMMMLNRSEDLREVRDCLADARLVVERLLAKATGRSFWELVDLQHRMVDAGKVLEELLPKGGEG